MRRFNRIESDILHILWETNPISSIEIFNLLQEPKPAYSTLALALRLLENKGIIEHKKTGQKYYYSPVFTRDSYILNKIEDFVDAYFLSDKLLMISFLEERMKGGR